MKNKCGNAFGWTRLEVLLTIALIVLVEGVIFYLAMVHGTSVSALNYVSFSGTLVSIILAVLAIVYTMYESTKQSTISAKIISSSDTIKISAEDLSKNISKLDDFSATLVHVKSKLENIESSQIEINGKLSGESSINKSSSGKTELGKFITGHFYFGPVMCGLSYLCSLNGGLSEGFIADEKYRDVRDLFCMENLTVDEGKFNVIFFVYYRCLEALSYLPKPNASDNSNAILQELYGMEKTVYRGRDYTHQRASFIKLLTLLRTDAEEEEKA